MKILLLSVLLILSSQIFASNYYFSSQNGDDSRSPSLAQNLATPWKTLSKLNSIFSILVPGDSILFKAGDTFYGQIITNRSGSAGQSIVFASYGIGEFPIISGLSQLSSWTNYGGNIYYTSLSGLYLNVVVLDGIMKAMGRYPKKGYLPYTSHSGNTLISGASIATLPFDATGAEIVIRKIRQITDRHIITSHSGNTIGLSATGDYGTVFANNTAYEPHDGNGYFIQSSINTLNGLGDWFYDRKNGRLYMDFGTSNPQNHSVKASDVDYIVKMDNVGFLKFINLNFEGANVQAISSNNSNNIAVRNCNLYKHYNAIFSDNGIENLSVQGGSISDILNNGVLVPQRGNNSIFDGIKLNNVGYIAGAGGSGDGQQIGIYIDGNNSIVRSCNFTNIGFHGIDLHGNNTLSEKNYIDTFSNIKDDAAGIYLSGMGQTNQIIRNNIILNAIGVVDGASPDLQISQAAGIYIDNADNVQVSNNVVAHGEWAGIWLIDVGKGIKIVNNLVYDHRDQLQIYNDHQTTGLTITGNKFIAKTIAQTTLNIAMAISINPALLGKLDSNIYARPIDDDKTLMIDRNYSGGGGQSVLSLSLWKNSYNQDNNSAGSPKIITNTKDLRFEYNSFSSTKIINLDTNYIDIAGKSYRQNITLDPYSAVVLIEGDLVFELLPIKLLNFSGQLINNQVLLNWETNRDKNANGFFIEKMTDKQSWKSIGFLTLPDGTLLNNKYSFKDSSVSVGSNFYRIRIVALDEDFTYSKTILIQWLPDKNIIHQNVPNPFYKRTLIQFDLAKMDHAKILVYNSLGIPIAILVDKVCEKGPNYVYWNTENLPPGHYFYQIIIGSTTVTMPMVKSKSI